MNKLLELRDALQKLNNDLKSLNKADEERPARRTIIRQPISSSSQQAVSVPTSTPQPQNLNTSPAAVNAPRNELKPGLKINDEYKQKKDAALANRAMQEAELNSSDVDPKKGRLSAFLMEELQEASKMPLKHAQKYLAAANMANSHLNDDRKREVFEKVIAPAKDMSRLLQQASYHLIDPEHVQLRMNKDQYKNRKVSLAALKQKLTEEFGKAEEICEIAKNGQWSIKKTNGSMSEAPPTDVNTM